MKLKRKNKINECQTTSQWTRVRGCTLLRKMFDSLIIIVKWKSAFHAITDFNWFNFEMRRWKTKQTYEHLLSTFSLWKKMVPLLCIFLKHPQTQAQQFITFLLAFRSVSLLVFNLINKIACDKMTVKQFWCTFFFCSRHWVNNQSV